MPEGRNLSVLRRIDRNRGFSQYLAMPRCFSLHLLLLLLAATVFSGYSQESPLLERGDIVFVDARSRAIVRWRPGVGLREFTTIPITGSGGTISVDSKGNIYALMNRGGFDPVALIHRLNPATMQTEPLTSGTMIQSSGRMTVSSDDSHLIVAGQDQNSVWSLFKVDIATGAQSVLTTNFHSRFMDMVPAVEHPYMVARAGGGKIVVVDNAYGHVVEFNEDGSGRRLIKEMPYPFLPMGLAVGNGKIYVSGMNLPTKIFAIDPATGATNAVGDGSVVQYVGDIGFGLGGLLVNEPNKEVLVRVDLQTGAEEVVLEGYKSPRGIWEFAPEVARPTLGIARTDTGFTISWDDPDVAWVLQRSVKVGAESEWENFGTPEVGPRSVEVSAEGAAAYYRLVR